MTPEIMRRMLAVVLERLRVHTASREDHRDRWSVSDLATDLAPLLLDEMAKDVEMRERIKQWNEQHASAPNSIEIDVDPAKLIAAEQKGVNVPIAMEFVPLDPPHSFTDQNGVEWRFGYTRPLAEASACGSEKQIGADHADADMPIIVERSGQ